MYTHTGSTLHNPVTLTFDLSTSEPLSRPAIEYTSTEIAVDTIFLLKHRLFLHKLCIIEINLCIIKCQIV